MLSGSSYLGADRAKVMLAQLDRCKPLLFHAIIFAWHVWFDYHGVAAVSWIFKNRWDLVEKTYGFGTQYLTIWNQLILQVYFTVALVHDLLEMANGKFVRAKEYMRKILPYVFTALLFPTSFVVCINFWFYYSLDRDNIDEDNIMDLYIPHWINHGLHTTVLLLVCLEKVLVHRPYPPKAWAFAGVSFVMLSYSATCTVLHVLSGLWPYPLIREMSAGERVLFVLLNCLFGVFFVAVGEAINRRIWGETADAAKKRS